MFLDFFLLKLNVQKGTASPLSPAPAVCVLQVEAYLSKLNIKKVGQPPSPSQPPVCWEFKLSNFHPQPHSPADILINHIYSAVVHRPQGEIKTT